MVPRLASRVGISAMLTAICFSAQACGASPSAPGGSSESSATIESVVTTYRGAVVGSEPIVIEYPEALQVEVKVALGMPDAARVIMYVCVMETATSIGVGTCVGLVTTVADVRSRGAAQAGISTFLIDKTNRTTAYLYVAFAEGLVPWNLAGSTPPRVGEMAGGSRILAVSVLPKTITFRAEAG